MQSRANCQEKVSDHADGLDREDLLRTVVSLHDDVCSMTSDIREVLSENSKLKKEVDRLRGRQGGKQRLSEINRIRDDVDRLVHLYEAASVGRARPRQATRREEPDESHPPDRSSWMKKMMLFMMMAEMF